MENFSTLYLQESLQIISKLDVRDIENAVAALAQVRGRGGRLFILGVGGSAASASHAVNDFRKLAGFEAYCPSDNVSELTARVNDEGWESVFSAWLQGSRLSANDGLFILSVGGGNLEKNISPNIIKAIDYAKAKGAKIIGVVGRDGGYTAKNADVCIKIPTVNALHVTPHTETFHGLVWHLLVTHPLLKTNETKWESIAK